MLENYDMLTGFKTGLFIRGLANSRGLSLNILVGNLRRCRKGTMPRLKLFLQPTISGSLFYNVQRSHRK